MYETIVKDDISDEIFMITQSKVSHYRYLMVDKVWGKGQQQRMGGFAHINNFFEMTL